MPGADARPASRPVPARLFHLAEAGNVASILEHGLLSTALLAARSGMSEATRAAFLRQHRPDNVLLPDGVIVRDQRPMPPASLARALAGAGMVPGDWYALLNAHVFLWPDRARLERQRGAFGDRPQRVLTFDAGPLLQRFGAHAFVSPINSGNARRKPAPRGRDTLVPFASWRAAGWPIGQRTRPPAEFLFDCALPAASPFLLEIADAPSSRLSD